MKKYCISDLIMATVVTLSMLAAVFTARFWAPTLGKAYLLSGRCKPDATYRVITPVALPRDAIAFVKFQKNSLGEYIWHFYKKHGEVVRIVTVPQDSGRGIHIIDKALPVMQSFMIHQQENVVCKIEVYAGGKSQYNLFFNNNNELIGYFINYID